MKKLVSIIVLFFSLQLIFGKENKIEINADATLGASNSTVKEILYDKKGKDAETLSLLEWQNFVSPCITANADLIIYDKFYLSIGGLYTLPLSYGKMQDYDWANLLSTGGKEQTHYSKHDNKINSKYFLDIDAGTVLNIAPQIRLIPFISFKYSYYSFTAQNGYKQYGKKIGTQNDYDVREPWNSSIEKIPMTGKIITFQNQDFYLGAGAIFDFSITPKIDLNLGLTLLPSLKSQSMDFHHKRDLYTFFSYESKLEFDTSLLLEYKITDSSRFTTGLCFSYAKSGIAEISQSSDKIEWYGNSNPGRIISRDLNFQLGYTYKYEK